MEALLDFAALLGEPKPTPPPDNADPHPVILTVHPREWRIPFVHQWEAEYEIEVQHPVSCSGCFEECPVADYLDNIGIDENLYVGFPEPDHLSDEDLAALNGTVRYVVIRRTFSGGDGPWGPEWDVEYDFAWSDGEQAP